MALASVRRVALGCQASPAKKRATASMAFVASLTGPTGSPQRLAHRQASALPRLPVGMMKPGGLPVFRARARDAIA